ncbi:MAG: hypothetical protein K6B69_06730 [Lachnospiraceae bacterium]|nr:hypothetical protein [Lachnospiraceae bacterium]
MRAKYKQILIRFREDDPEHMKAWQYIRDMGSRNKATADVITELIREKNRGGTIAPASEKQLMEMLSDVRQLCLSMDDRLSRAAIPPAGTGTINDGEGQAETRGEGEVERGILDFALGMGD